MFTDLENRRDSVAARQKYLESVVRDCQLGNQSKLGQLIEYYFQTESANALLLIKQFGESGKEQFKMLLEHLNTQGLKVSNRSSGNMGTVDLHSNEEQEKAAQTMKVFRILCLVIHSQVSGLPSLIRESTLVPNCFQAIAKYREDPNILAQGCYFIAALIATLPNEIIQHTDSIINIFKATCKYLSVHLASLRQFSIQTHSHSLDNVQLWIVNQAAHALFYTLYAVYPCNFLVYIQREFQRTENLEILEHILFPMFQRVRFNRCLISSDRKRELDKEKRLRQDSCHIIYEARKLSLDPLFGREPPVNSNWMHHEMKRILPFYQFKRQSPARSLDQLSDGVRSNMDISTTPEATSKRASSSPFQKFKDKIKSFVRPTSSSSTPSTTISSPNVEISTANNNTLSVPNASSSALSSQALPSDIRAVKTMPELPSSTEFSTSNVSTPTTQRSDQQQQVFIRSIIHTISSIYEQSIPSHWRKILGRYDPNLLIVSTPHRQATFYVSPSEHSLDNQQPPHTHFDDSSPTSTNEKRQRCASASCASSQHVHSPVLAAPTTSTDEILPRTQSLSTKQRTRHAGVFHQKHFLTHQTQYEEDDDNVLVDHQSISDPWPMQIPSELYLPPETKTSLGDDFGWNDHDFFSNPHFDFNDIVSNNCSSNQLKQFDRLYECHSNYEIFLTEQYKKLYEHIWAKERSYQKHFNDLQTTLEFMEVLRSDVHGHLSEELKIYERNSDCLSDENSFLAEKLVQVTQETSRRKQTTTNDGKTNEFEELKQNCAQLRKTMSNETLKLNNLQHELHDNQKETQLTEERVDELKILIQNLTYLNELNQQLECQYLRVADEVPTTNPSHSVSSQRLKDGSESDQQQQQMRSSVSIATNGQEEQSELDSVSFCEERREDMDDFPQNDEGQTDNYDQLLEDLIQALTEQNTNNHMTRSDIENKAYDILLKYMQSKANMQEYLKEHNRRYIDLYLETQQDYIVQMESKLSSNQLVLEQMKNVAI